MVTLGSEFFGLIYMNATIGFEGREPARASAEQWLGIPLLYSMSQPAPYIVAKAGRMHASPLCIGIAQESWDLSLAMVETLTASNVKLFALVNFWKVAELESLLDWWKAQKTLGRVSNRTTLTTNHYFDKKCATCCPESKIFSD
jgi:hypothetical protein